MFGSLRARCGGISTSWRLLIIGLTFIGLAVTGCGDNAGDDSTSQPASEESAAEPADGFAVSPGEQPAAEPADDRAADSGEEGPAEEARAEDESGGSGGLAVPTSLTPADIGRDIIFNATISVEVDDVAAAGREAQTVIEGLGGIVFGQETVTEPEPRTVLTFKVFPRDFSEALERLADLGDLVNQQVSADDVTERVVDLQSRITTAAASVERLRLLIEDAGAVDIIAQLENQLLERETTLEQLRGQLRTIQDQVDLATITLTITPSPRVVPRTGVDIVSWLSEGGDDPCLGSDTLEVDPDATVQFCFEVANIGDTSLTEIDLQSGELRLRLDELTVVDGDVDQLEPGDRLVLTTTETLADGRLGGLVATRGLAISTTVTATPVDEQGDRLTKVDDTTGVTLFANEDDSLPGFGDAFGAGISALAFVGSVVLVVAGVLLPFVPLAAIVVLAIVWIRRRQARRVSS